MSTKSNEVVEGNKLIHAFMGWTCEICTTPPLNVMTPAYHYIDGTGRNMGYGLSENSLASNILRYHSSWDWLMPVVIRCHQVGKEKENEFAGIDSTLDDAKGWRAWNYRRVHLNTEITSVWKFCVQFINWYNQNNK